MRRACGGDFRRVKRLVSATQAIFELHPEQGAALC